jgi:methylase of polypeptide subunit release factors
MSMDIDERALAALGARLRELDYRFVTPTPATHRRVNARPANATTGIVTGARGWSRPFARGALPHAIERGLEDARALAAGGGLLRSTVRCSTIDDDVRGGASLYVHSAHPTLGADAVFFGPDTYRFVSLLRRVLRAAGRLVDVGAGSGAGGLSVLDRCDELVLADINPGALALARVNAGLARGRAAATVATVESDVLAGVSGRIDAVIANPPYLVDPERRLYRDGGGALGHELSLRIVSEALERLAPGGQLVLYTGSAVVDGRHPLHDALRPRLAARRCRSTWEELDPDVFGEELDAPAYQDVDRLAVVALVVEVE